MPRRKRRPDVVKLNVVQSVPGRRKKIRIEPLECPLAPLPSVRSETPGELVGHTDPGGSVCYDNDAQEEPLSHSEVQERSGTYKERKDKAAEAWADICLKILFKTICTFPSDEPFLLKVRVNVLSIHGTSLVWISMVI